MGFGSIASFALLFWKERKGDERTTSTTHKRLHVAFSSTTRQCHDSNFMCDANQTGVNGTNVIQSETSVEVMSTYGYRPLKILFLGGGAAAVYASIVALIFAMKVAPKPRQEFARD